MTQPWTIVVLSLLILLFMSGVLIFFYLRTLDEEVADLWFLLKNKLHNRLDKLPALFEISAKMTTGQEALIKDLIFLRSQSWSNGTANRAKVATELNLSSQLHQLWDVAKKTPELSKNSIFLQAKTELKDIGELIEKDLEKYNEKVRKFNKRVGFFLFLPFVLLFRQHKKTIFEFEP